MKFGATEFVFVFCCCLCKELGVEEWLEVPARGIHVDVNVQHLEAFGNMNLEEREEVKDVGGG